MESKERIMDFKTLQHNFLSTFGTYIEEFGRIFIYLVPIKEGDSEWEMHTQSLFSLLEVFSLYKEHILNGTTPFPTPLSKTQEKVLETAQFALRVVRCVQLLLEIRDRRRNGVKSSLKLCARIELLKFFIRFTILLAANTNIMVEEETLHDWQAQLNTKKEADQVFIGKRTGLCFPSIESLHDPSKPVDLIDNPPSSSKKGFVYDHIDELYQYWQRSNFRNCKKDIAAAEVLMLLRPTIHALLQSKYDSKSWIPWSYALLSDLFSYSVAKRNIGELSLLETLEVSRRHSLLFFSLIRSPLFEYTLEKPFIKLDSLIKKIPILSYFSVVDLFLSFRHYHFSTSGS